MNKIVSFLWLFLAFISCSDFDEQEFTVLIPNAGTDQIIFTEVSGTTIQLDGSNSSDVNNLGFEYQWNVISFPEGLPITIENPNIATPTFEVSNDAGGRYELSLQISIGDQVATDFVNIDINPAIADILFVNAVDSELTAVLNIPDVDYIGNPVSSKSTSESYIEVDTNISKQADGTTLLEVTYNDIILSTNETIDALKSYTLYLVGTETNPELHLVEKTRNQNTIGQELVGLEFINLSMEASDVVLFIDARAFSFGILPIDTLFGALGVPEQFDILNYLDNNEIFFPSGSIFALPIWATTNLERISNDSAITLPANEDGNFGTFMLFPDASSEFGHTLLFINNSDLLLQ